MTVICENLTALRMSRITHTENIANDILVSKEDVETKIKEIKSVLF